jgi:hypothetical protein
MGSDGGVTAPCCWYNEPAAMRFSTFDGLELQALRGSADRLCC